MDVPPVSYTDIELESYIPSGWVLAEGQAPEWDPGRQELRVTVLDSSDLDWILAVKRSDAERLGRIEALRQAVDRLDRERFESII
ncbi:MAG TPA: hypothetical protein VMT16_04285 [Thermoanaerobaculia bacterium]|nr:hypothetical protein [Thermoanaerobaculia bacterium]